MVFADKFASNLNNASTRVQTAQASVGDQTDQQVPFENARHRETVLPPKTKTLESKETNDNVRIMCMIFTMPEHWETKARAVRLTWAQRCTKYMFFYSRTSTVHLPEAFALDVPEGRDHLTAKTMSALRLSFENYKDSIDWFLKADDDTFIIMENMKHLLSSLDPKKPHYIGGRSTDFLKNGYNGGGAGYLLSWEAARSVVEESDRFGCALDRGYEDLEMGKCLANFHIYPIDTRDENQRVVFHCDHPLKLLAGESNAPDVYTYQKGNVTFGNRQVKKALRTYFLFYFIF